MTFDQYLAPRLLHDAIRRAHRAADAVARKHPGWAFGVVVEGREMYVEDPDLGHADAVGFRVQGTPPEDWDGPEFKVYFGINMTRSAMVADLAQSLEWHIENSGRSASEAAA